MGEQADGEERLTRREWRRKMAAETFNFAWSLIEKPDRTPDDDERMVHAAHASRFLWQEVGDAGNWAVGEWQVAHVYTLLGRTAEALHHAALALQTCEHHGVHDWQRAFAYEALARAHAHAGNAAERDRYLVLADAAGREIAEADDREHFFKQLATVSPTG